MTKAGVRGAPYALTHADAASQLWMQCGRRGGPNTGPLPLLCTCTGSRAALTARLWEDGTIAGLSAAGPLARFELARRRPGDFRLRLSEPAVLLTPDEWCGPAWQLAAVAVLRLLAELSARELTLESVRPELVGFFGGTRPAFVHPGCIVPATPAAYLALTRQLADFLVLPLYLFATQRGASARRLLAAQQGWLDFADVAGALAAFSTKYVLTEFIGFDQSSGNPYAPSDRPGSERWYTLDGFMSALGRRFRPVILVPGPPGRRLILAEK